MTVGSNDAHTTDHAFCAWCGSGLVKSARFCPGCGRPTADSSSVPDAPPVEWMDGETSSAVVEPAVHEPLLREAENQPLWASVAPSAFSETTPRRPRFRRPSGRWALIMAAGTALLLVASIAGVAGYRHMRDQPVRDSFAAAQRSFTPVIRSLEDAEDLEQVTFAGERSAQVVKDLEKHRVTAAGADTDLARQVTKVLAAEVAVAKAGAELAELSETDVTVWGEAHESLAGSLKKLSAATDALSTNEPEAAKSVANGGAMLANLESVVGSAVAEAAESSLASLLGDLGTAKKTADVQAVAASAAREGESAKTAATGIVRGSEQGKQLQAFVGVYDALEGLAVLDGETLGDWGSMRQPLTAALGGIAGDSPVAGSGRDAVANVNRLVDRARTRLDDWKSTYDAAVDDKAADSAALEQYAGQMEAQMRAYSALRGDLSEWVQRVEDPSAYVTYDDAYAELSQAQWDRQAIRDEMNGLAVPAEMEGPHAELVPVVDDAITAMQAAYDGATDSDYCITSCYYKDTPGWTRFRAESSRITDAYRAADENWQAALAGAESSIANRTLPRKPVV